MCVQKENVWHSFKCWIRRRTQNVANQKQYFLSVHHLLFGGLSPVCRLLRWCSGKESASCCIRRRRRGFYPGSGRSPGEGNGNPLQYSCLETSTDREDWQSRKESAIAEQQSMHTLLSAMVFSVLKSPIQVCRENTFLPRIFGCFPDSLQWPQ